ncbi:golvesin C-terminal-like domain-containing protein [Streptomyces sp. NBC_01716]|uniref:golvesin C-terminal-like domain-containing protein n=1 Tax=Streptomyces sp. NBC_01716 TaxID=2975917 RepID=UPI002E31C605|nr:exo-alpha-sialidase [Streptomyces sp. NBC_01716]
MSDTGPKRTAMNRRSFALGVAGVSATAAFGPAALGSTAHAAGRSSAPGLPAAPDRHGSFFHEQTLWDSVDGPLVNYHVHALAVLPDDTILAVTEGRHEVCDAGPRDLLLRRSTDGGRTWEASRALVTSADGDSWGNPALVVDRETREVFLFYMLSLRLPENTSCSGDSGDLYVISSRDSGRTWGEVRNLAGLFDGFPYNWALHGPGPGHGLQLKSGRLLLNCSHRRVIVGNTVAERYYGVAPICSDDHGATWRATGEVPVQVKYPINEARMVQRSDGTVLVNGRAAAGGEGQRIVSVSSDDGTTWSQPAFDGGTGSFNAVDAGLLRYSGGPGSRDTDRVLFSRPDSPVRYNMTVSVSYDEGISYRYRRVINENRSFYSDLARLSDGTIVLLYGCDGDLASAPRRVNVCRFSLDWLTRGRDSLRRGPRHRETAIVLADTDREVTGGTVKAVADPLARSGERLVLTPEQVGGAAEFTFRVPRTGEYELVLRHYRSADGALATVTVRGTKLPAYVIDTTAQSADGFDLARIGTARLRAGRHTVRCEVTGAGRGGGTVLGLDSLSLVEAPGSADVRAEVVVDNDRLGFAVVTGSWPTATADPGFWAGNYRTAPAGSGERMVRWRPAVPRDGVYEIQTSFPPGASRAGNAPYSVVRAEGTTSVRVDQRVAGAADPRGGSWVSLGKFRLRAGLGTSVELTNDADGTVVADAIRLLGPRT